MEEQKVTIKELVDMTINDLRNLSIPAYMLNQFGPPISRALNNLNIMHNVFENAEKQEQASNDSEEPIIENV